MNFLFKDRISYPEWKLYCERMNGIKPMRSIETEVITQRRNRRGEQA